MNNSKTVDPPAIALVADDEPLVRMATTSLLEKAGYTVLEAANAADALLLFRSNDDIMLLVTDIEMPGPVDGLGLARQVSQVSPATVIVVISGHVRPASHELPEHASFIAKPFDPYAIVAKARDVAQTRSGRVG